VLLLDVASAYDSVNQQCLVDTLRELGVPQHLVRAVQGMYRGLNYSVRDSEGNLGDPFPAGVGVKQGCPASPLLFCMYVQPVSAELEGVTQADAYTLDGSTPLPDWAYADDFMLLATSKSGVQRLTGAAARAFLARHLRLEPHKCVVFGVECGEEGGISVDEQCVPQAPEQGTRYLGLMYDRKASAKVMAQHRGGCMLTAFRRARAKVCVSDEVPSSIPVMLDLLSTSVMPAGLYGCELWGLLSVLSVPGVTDEGLTVEQLYALDDPMEKLRLKAIRAWLNLPHGTPCLPLLHELGLEPLVMSYVRRAVGWWNHVVTLEPDSPWRLAMQQNVRDAQNPNFRGVNFSRALTVVLRVLLGSGSRGLSNDTVHKLQTISLERVEAGLAATYKEYLQSQQTQAGSMIRRYFTVVGTHEAGVRPCWYTFQVPHRVMVRFLRFRLGCHYLRLNTGRWERRRQEGGGTGHLPREQRVCLRCEQPYVDDEDHCLVYCQEVCIRTHRQQLEAAVRRRHPHPAMNSMAGLFQAVQETGSRELQFKLLHYVAYCFQVSWRCFVDLNGWRASDTVRSCAARQAMQAYVLQRESTYSWEYDRLSSSLVFTSELQEVTPGDMPSEGGEEAEVTSRAMGGSSD
jgi:hypothetical protein